MSLKTNYKEKETLRERGTKRYQERLVEEKEAEKEIKEYIIKEEDHIGNESESHRENAKA